MNSRKSTKINDLLKIWPKGVLVLQVWLDQQKIYRQLAEVYCSNDWITRLSSGVYSRSGEQVNWTGGLYALQQEMSLQIHVSANSALEMSGLGQYIHFASGGSIWLFIDAGEKRKVPLWFEGLFGKQYEFHYIKTNLFTSCSNLGIQPKVIDNFSVMISAPERAIMECLYLVPNRMALDTVSDLMEKMRTLRPWLVQKLLECCASVKVKRLFLYLSELHNHTWFKELNMKNINLGVGARKIGKGGKFISKYHLSVPEIKDEGYSDEEVIF